MKLSVTITAHLDDEFWGWSNLLENGKLTIDAVGKIVELINEDIGAFLENSYWELHLPSHENTKRLHKNT